MGEMIERVANAIRDELINIGYGVGTINSEQLSGVLARAAIKAMREPTEDMKMMGAMYLPDYDPGEDDSEQCWQDMIDAALKD